MCEISPQKILRHFLLGMMLGLAEGAMAQVTVTPAQWLANQPKPQFKPGHRLPHLTKFGWPFSLELTVEMATNWGYALHLEPLDDTLASRLANTNSAEYKILKLSSTYPDTYKLQVNLERFWPTNLSDGFWVTNAAGWFVDTSTNSWQFRTNKNYQKFVSPEASDADIAIQAAAIVAPLRLVASNAHIAIVINGGERDLGLVADSQKAWQQDPRVQQTAVMTNAYNFSTNKAGLSWYRYSSKQKARHLASLTTAIKEIVPDMEHYVWYNTGSEQSRYKRPANTGYDWDNTWTWAWSSIDLLPAVGIPNFENYYFTDANFTNATGTLWYNVTDLLTKNLAAVGFNIGLGYTTNYSWVCGGWNTTNTTRLADINRYKGLLKCLYTSGTIGACAGYFSYPISQTNSFLLGGPGFNASFPPDKPPHWLQQIRALSEVHAQFSYLDDYLFSGSLLEGNGVHFKCMDQPSYEFTNTVADATARVLVRKLNNRDDWLVTAWAAAGNDRTVYVNIPTVGRVGVLASASGSVYRATLTTLMQLTEVGFPDARPGAPTGLRVEQTDSP